RVDMAALLDTIGECLTKLDQGDFTESLAALDHYEYNSAAFPISTSFTDDNDNDNDADADADAERLSIASSSFSEVASFRDASSSPIWYDIQPPEAIPEQPLSSQESSSASYSAQDVLQILRRMISRQEALIRTKVTYENHLAQMAVHLQQQSTQIEALSRSASADGDSSERAAEKKPGQTTKERAPAHIKQLSATPNWWSTFLPGGLSTTAAAAATAATANSATVPDSDNATATSSAMNTDMAAAIASASSMTRNLDTSDNWSPPAI
ncbi:hypothetical protein LPJ57_010070, partial [Coemansia sp. RSA 486]